MDKSFSIQWANFYLQHEVSRRRTGCKRTRPDWENDDGRSGIWLRVCGTDGVQAHASGLGIAMGHDTKSVRCVLALEPAFLRPRGPPTEVPATAGFHACGRILGCLHMI